MKRYVLTAGVNGAGKSTIISIINYQLKKSKNKRGVSDMIKMSESFFFAFSKIYSNYQRQQ